MDIFVWCRFDKFFLLKIFSFWLSHIHMLSCLAFSGKKIFYPIRLIQALTKKIKTSSDKSSINQIPETLKASAKVPSALVNTLLVVTLLLS
jgi:hypothetical protein